MTEHQMNHNLIESILMLLNRSANINSVMEHSQRRGWATQADFTNPQHIDMAYELIKFMDEMPGGFLIYHADDTEKIIYANTALLRIFRCDTLSEFQTLTGNSFKGIVHPEDLDAVEQSITEQIAASHYDLDYVEYRIICKDGTIRWIEDYGHFIHSESIGDIFYVFLSDATEKREQLLREKTALMNEKIEKEQKIQSLIEEYGAERKLISQEHLRRLEVIEGLSVNYESILYVDLDADEVFPYRLSSRTKQQFGERFQARSFLWYVTDYVNVWVHSEDKAMVLEMTSPDYIYKKLSIEKTYYVNFRVIENNEIRYLQLRIVDVSKGEHISQIVIGYRNVDEEILLEMEKKRLLEDALHKAELSNVAKNTFLANMSHDMRTPLNAILGFTELSKKHAHDTDAMQQYFHKIESSGKQLLDLIDKVLELSHMESQDMPVMETECNLHDIMQEVYSLQLPQAAKKNISLSLQCAAPERCNVYADKDKLKQIFLYLSANALQYTPSGGKVDMVMTKREKLPNNYGSYQFVIKDTGIGIHEDALERIFEPFEREKNTTSSGIHGTGLGLTITKNIVERLGGTISVDSTIGKGSTFTVTLHLRLQNHPQSPSATPEDIIAGLRDKKILLVEDNEINLEMETAILEELGFCIESAENGSVAVEKVKASRDGEYALILMDIQMPVMDGPQAARAIRALDNPAQARIPMIALSANAFESDKQLSMESGMNAHLAKPINIPQLLEAIARTIHMHSMSQEDSSSREM